jgi:hypothetical protein
MEGMLCARALKSAYGRQKHHTQTGLHVCCERALKSTGKRTKTGGVVAGAFGKPPARGTLGVIVRASSGSLAAGGTPPAGKVLAVLFGVRLRRTQLAALTTS